jgi:beta-lactamase regulating signal transducer with metallopeptidase domain
MNAITRFMTDEVIHAAGWTILHSLWQGMAIALLLAMVLLALRRYGPQARYLAGLAAMLAVVAVALVTFFTVYEPGISPAVSGIEVAPGVENPPAVTASAANSANLGWADIVSYFNQHLPLLVLFWLLGVLVLTLRTAGELVFLQHLRYNRSKPAGPKWQQYLEQLAAGMQLRIEVQLRESRRIHSPMVIGFIKPIVLVPVGLLANLPPGQVESALAHELAHIRRHDYLVNLLQSMTETLFFFNPAVWWISSLVRTEREHCCDDRAVAMTGDEVTFVKMLATLEEYRMRHVGLVVGLTGSRGSVLGRIQRLLDGRQSQHVPFRIFWSTMILLPFMGMAAFSWNPGQVEQLVTPEQEKTKVEITRLDTMPPSAMPASMEMTEASIISEPAPGALGQSPEPPVEGVAIREVHGVATPARAVADTIPEAEKERRRKMGQLQREIQERRLQFEKERLQVEEKMNQMKQDMQRAQNVRETKMLELEEKAQKLRNEQALKQEEQEINESELRNEITEIEGELQSLEIEVQEEQSKESPSQQRVRELEEQWKVLHKRKLELQKQANEAALEQQKAMFEIQKQLRALEEMRLTIQKETQMKQHEQQLMIMEIQQKSQKLANEQQLLENEYQLKLLELQKDQSN